MKNCVALFVLLLGVLTLTTFAQQSVPASNDHSTASVPEQRDPLTAPKRTDFWDGDQPNLADLLTHPFASKEYVRRYTAPIKDRLNELDEIRSENSSNINDIDARSKNGLQLASEKVSAADQHAGEASSRAQGAQSAASEAANRVSRVEQRVGNLDHYVGGGPQTEIRFRTGQTILSKSAKEALDGLAAPLKNQKNYIVEIRSYSAGHGSTAIANSARLADSVTRYLVLSHEIPAYRVRSIGLGNPPSGEVTKRVSGSRVQVNVLRNDQETAAQR